MAFLPDVGKIIWRYARDKANFFENLDCVFSSRYMDDLFQLIKSLTEAERKFFRQYASLYHTESNYLRLFDFIDGLADYSDEQVKQAFRGEKFINQLSVSKNYLNEVILRTFRLSAEGGSPDTDLQIMLMDVRFLMQKKCLSQVKKLLKRLHKLAEQQENFLILLQVYALERNLLTEFRFEAREQITFDSIAAEEAQTLVKLQNVNTLYHLYCKAKVFITTTRFTLNNAADLQAFNTIFAEPELQDANLALSVRAKHWFHSAWHFKHVFYAEAQEDLQNCLAHKQLFESTPLFAESRPLSHLTVINNILEAYRATNNLDAAVDALNQLSAVRVSVRRDVEAKTIYVAHHEMWIALRKQAYAQAFDTAVEELDRLERSALAKKDSVIYQYMLIAIVCITSGKWQHAAQAINALLSIPKSGIREDILEHARILQLIILMETGQYDVASGLLRNIKRSAVQYPVIELLAEHNRQVLKSPNAASIQLVNADTIKRLSDSHFLPPEEFPELIHMLRKLFAPQSFPA